MALGRGGKETNQNGALRTVAEQLLGKRLLWLRALGFAGYALWRLLEVVYGETGGDGGAGGWVKSGVRGAVYAPLCITTITLVTGSGSANGGSAGQSQTLTAPNTHEMTPASFSGCCWPACS